MNGKGKKSIQLHAPLQVFICCLDISHSVDLDDIFDSAQLGSISFHRGAL